MNGSHRGPTSLLFAWSLRRARIWRSRLYPSAVGNTSLAAESVRHRPRMGRPGFLGRESDRSGSNIFFDSRDQARSENKTRTGTHRAVDHATRRPKRLLPTSPASSVPCVELASCMVAPKDPVLVFPAACVSKYLRRRFFAAPRVPERRLLHSVRAHRTLLQDG
jgi:hypothetical protein